MLRNSPNSINSGPNVSFRRGQEGVAQIALLIIVGIAFVIAAGIIIYLMLSAGPGPVTYTVFKGTVTAPASFPQLIDQGTAVTYTVTTNTITVPYGAGPGFPPTAKTKPVPVKNAVVVFSLAKGDATFADGSTSKSVTTNAAGVANVTIIPAQDGDDKLSFLMKITTGKIFKTTHTVPDNVSYDFEVDLLP